MIDDFHNISPYSLETDAKNRMLVKELKELLLYHVENCKKYGNILYALGFNENRIKEIRDVKEIPYLPVRIFKEMELKSMPDEEIFKVMKSSGTTGQSQSKIYLDKKGRLLQPGNGTVYG